MSPIPSLVANYTFVVLFNYFIYKRLPLPLKVCTAICVFGNLILIRDFDLWLHWNPKGFIALLVLAGPQFYIFRRHMLPLPGEISLLSGLYGYSIWTYQCLIPSSDPPHAALTPEQEEALSVVLGGILVDLAIGITSPHLGAIWAFLTRYLPRRLLGFSLVLIQCIVWGSYFRAQLRQYYPEWYVYLLRLLWEDPVEWLSVARFLASTWTSCIIFMFSAYDKHFFVYRALDVANSEIRLLKLLPSSYGGPIRTELIHIPISQAKDYEAISYRWEGEKSDIFPIFIGDEIELLAPTVHILLSFLRDNQEERLYWIDAVCINQDDEEEKIRQIMLMRQIYSTADRVIAWQGYKAASSGVLKSIGSAFATTTGFAELYHVARYGTYSSQWIDNIALFSNDFFSRVWIIQEIALAQSIIIRYGPETLPWQDLLDFAVALYNAEAIYPTLGATLFLTVEAQEKFSDSLNNMASMAAIRNHYQAELKGLSLYEALRLSKKFGATFPVDKIYGILGLVTEEARQKVLINYTEAARGEVLLSVARFVLFSEGSIDGLAMAGIHDSDNDKNLTNRLASWVPSWGMPLHGNKAVRGYVEWTEAVDIREYNCYSHGSTEIHDIEESGQLLGVSVGVIDTIESLSSIWDTSRFLIEPNPDLSRRFVLDHTFGATPLFPNGLHMANMTSVWNPNDTINMPFWRAIISPVWMDFYLKNRSLEAASDVFENFFDLASKDTIESLQEWTEFLYVQKKALTLMSMVLNRRLSITRNKRFGNVPPTTRPGDLVVAISGSSVPYIVRPIPKFWHIWGSVPKGSVFELIGPCYIDGVMDGELVGRDIEFRTIVLA
jgi:hypothetical protein